MQTLVTRLFTLLLATLMSVSLAYGAEDVAYLLTAASKGDVATVNAMLASGANPNIKDDEGISALMYAAHCGHVKTVEELIAAGADRDVRDCNGLTAADLATN